MTNTDLQSPGRPINDTDHEKDELSIFLEEYALNNREQPDPDNNLISEITSGIKKLNGILEGLNLPEKQNFMSAWVTPEQVKLKLGIAERTLAVWRKTGKLPYTRLVNKIYYKKQDWENLLLSRYQRNKNQPDAP